MFCDLDSPNIRPCGADQVDKDETRGDVTLVRVPEGTMTDIHGEELEERSS